MLIDKIVRGLIDAAIIMAAAAQLLDSKHSLFEDKLLIIVKIVK